jgi:hypothetical protein
VRSKVVGVEIRREDAGFLGDGSSSVELVSGHHAHGDSSALASADGLNDSVLQWIHQAVNCDHGHALGESLNFLINIQILSLCQ